MEPKHSVIADYMRSKMKLAFVTDASTEPGEISTKKRIPENITESNISHIITRKDSSIEVPNSNQTKCYVRYQSSFLN